MYWTDQTNRRQTNDRGHSGWGEASGGATLLLSWGLLILWSRLWTRYYHKMLWCMGQIQRVPARPHLPLISHHLRRKGLQFVRPECHAPCKRNLGSNRIRLASPAAQWSSYDSLDVWCRHQGPSQLAGSLGEDAAWRSGKNVLRTHRLRWHGHVERSDGWLKKVQKLNPTGGRGRGLPKKTWTEVIDMAT